MMNFRRDAEYHAENLVPDEPKFTTRTLSYFVCVY